MSCKYKVGQLVRIWYLYYPILLWVNPESPAQLENLIKPRVYVSALYIYYTIIYIIYIYIQLYRRMNVRFCLSYDIKIILKSYFWRENVRVLPYM